mmetsp:Transcript_61766/g.194826  ORF Transcript_61766/g.194826 Transcript_61766/m.194826 type:complete len:334 (+) Transcript_61766:127-1128(+)
MGAANSCQSCNSAAEVFGVGRVERCTNFCGERRCRVACTVRRVVIWRRGPWRPQPSLSTLPRSVCVEVEPLGWAEQTLRTEAGVQEMLARGPRNGELCKESWVWGDDAAQKGAAAATCGATASAQKAPLVFEVTTSAQLLLRVLEVQGLWTIAGTAPLTSNCLGESRLRLSEDIASPLGIQEAPPWKSCDRCLPLILGSRICGQVEVSIAFHYEDVLLEFRGLVKDVGDCGNCQEGVLPPLLSGRWAHSKDVHEGDEIEFDPPKEDLGLSPDMSKPLGRAKPASILPLSPEEVKDIRGPCEGASFVMCGSRPFGGCPAARRSAISCITCTARA